MISGRVSVATDMKPLFRALGWLAVGLCATAGPGRLHAEPTRQAAASALAADEPARASAERTVVVERRLRGAEDRGELTYRLLRDDHGKGSLVRVGPDGAYTEIACDELIGAWGLWLEDVDGDRDREAVIALRKTARFDPVLENRLHVYALVGDRCVPMWRGTRLAGRFDMVNPHGGALLALERIGRGRRRVARYRWTGFGYALDRTLWVGAGEPPKRLQRKLTR